MSDNVQPVPYDQGGPVGPHHPGNLREPWLDDEDDEGGAQALTRVLAALKRYRWLLLISVGIGAGAGWVAYETAAPVYETEGAFWVVRSRSTDLAGPVQQAELLGPEAWSDLLRTTAVLGPVVLQERLYLRTSGDNRAVMEDFRIPTGADYAPGRYEVAVSENGRRWTLRTHEGIQLEEGAVGEPIGRSRGFDWTPPASELTAGRLIDFQVVTTTDAARDLRARVQSVTTRDGNFINLTLRGDDPEQIASILRGVMSQLQEVALGLKQVQLDSTIAHLQQQADSAEAVRAAAQGALESFRISTATQPTAESTPVAAGLQSTQSTVMGEFYRRRFEREDMREQRERLEALLASMEQVEGGGGVPVIALERIPAVQASSELSRALAALVEDRATLNTLRQIYTDAHGAVQDVQGRIERAEQEQIPALVQSVISQLRAQEGAADAVLDGRADELREIPSRAIREVELQYDMNSANEVYSIVQQRLATNRLAKASTQNDLQVIQEPAVPQLPSQDERIRLFLIAFFACVGVGAGAAILLDRLDPRLRYPNEVSGMMGLEILGGVPRIKGSRKGNAGQVLEAFREIRMRVQYAYGSARPLVMAVTSPEAGEGKTFVSANLAITFAQLGKKTLVIDADTRRGDMHDLFETERKPGLTDLFRRTVDHSVIQKTRHENLHFLPCGSRFADSPELLSSGDMQELLAAAKRRYEIIMIDCPPLAAGSDAFILGAHAGSVLVVLRSGSTHKELARAKMEAFYRLPVRLLGAVLNDIEPNASYGAYRYYSYYLPGYEAGREEEEGEEASRAVAL